MKKALILIMILLMVLNVTSALCAEEAVTMVPSSSEAAPAQPTETEPADIPADDAGSVDDPAVTDPDGTEVTPAAEEATVAAETPAPASDDPEETPEAEPTEVIIDQTGPAAEIFMTITITGKQNSSVYDGQPHTAEGYSVSEVRCEGGESCSFSSGNLSFSGKAFAQQTEPGIAWMGLSAEQFEYHKEGVSAAFIVIDGYQEITEKESSGIVDQTGSSTDVIYDDTDNGGNENEEDEVIIQTPEEPAPKPILVINTEVPAEEPTEELTETPEADITDEPTDTPEADVTDESTETPEADVTDEPTETPEADATGEPAETSEADVTDEPAETPEADATDELTETPEADVTDEPIETSEADVTDEPAETPEADVTDEPTETPEADETADPDEDGFRVIISGETTDETAEPADETPEAAEDPEALEDPEAAEDADPEVPESIVISADTAIYAGTDGESEVIFTAGEDTELTVISVENGWALVQLPDGTTGYIPMPEEEAAEETPEAGEEAAPEVPASIVIAADTVIYAGADGESEVIFTAGEDTELTVISVENGWALVQLPDGTTGYIPMPEEETGEEAAETIPVGADIAIRLGPDGMSEVILLSDGELEVVILGVEGDWVKVQLPDGTIGYIYYADLEPEEAAPKTYMAKKVTIFTDRRMQMDEGETITLSSRLEGFEDCSEIRLQWECNKGGGFEPVSGANGRTYSYPASVTTLSWSWRLEVLYR